MTGVEHGIVEVVEDFTMILYYAMLYFTLLYFDSDSDFGDDVGSCLTPGRRRDSEEKFQILCCNVHAF